MKEYNARKTRKNNTVPIFKSLPNSPKFFPNTKGYMLPQNFSNKSDLLKWNFIYKENFDFSIGDRPPPK